LKHLLLNTQAPKLGGLLFALWPRALVSLWMPNLFVAEIDLAVEKTVHILQPRSHPLAVQLVDLKGRRHELHRVIVEVIQSVSVFGAKRVHIGLQEDQVTII
jgi:hypothetical protein